MGKNKEYVLEDILDKTVDIIGESKNDIFDICESAREEQMNIESEIKLINLEIDKVINDLKKKRTENRKARLQLMEVSREVEESNEAEIKKAYQKAEKTSVAIAVLTEKEEQLKERRSRLEERMNRVKKTEKKAENLVSRFSVVKEFLQGELKNLSSHFEDLREKQKVAMKIIQAQEEERKRVAREIHDGPAQSLANLIFRFEFAYEMIDKDYEKAKEELVDLRDVVKKSVKDVRKIIYDLRTMSLDDLGLVPTLEKYIEKFSRQTELEIDFKVLGEVRRLDDCYHITVFRLVQEGLNNINTHAHATSARVILEYKKENINLLIVDDGRGFDIDEVKDDKFGLISMRERCELLQGSLEINSRPKLGTRINIKIPLKEGEYNV